MRQSAGRNPIPARSPTRIVQSERFRWRLVGAPVVSATGWLLADSFSLAGLEKGPACRITSMLWLSLAYRVKTVWLHHPTRRKQYPETAGCGSQLAEEWIHYYYRYYCYCRVKKEKLRSVFLPRLLSLSSDNNLLRTQLYFTYGSC